MSIMEKAKVLGEAIVDSQEYKDLKDAETKMYQDEQAKSLLDDFSAKQKRLQMAQANGQAISEKQQKEIQAVHAQMQGNEKVKEYMQAQQQFNQIMQTVNQTISSVMTEDSPETE
ncbi:MAG: YlbF family regulator [Halanaerobiaceae bacterium]